VLVAASMTGAVVEGVVRTSMPARGVGVAVAVVLAPALLWRRTRPLGAVAVAFTVSGLAPLATGGQPPDVYSMVYMLLLPYALLRWGSGREIVLGSAVLFAKAALWVAAGFSPAGNEVGEVVVLVTALALGAAFRYRAGARARELMQAQLLERERLARDLHDTVAHHVSAMAIRAQAGLVMAQAQPDAATDALRLIDAEASRALTEMRTMVRVLRRDEAAERGPGKGIGDVGELATNGGGDGGLRVLVETHGELGRVGQSVGGAVYRMAQESVTNARRYGRGATQVVVAVAVDGDAVRLTVEDDGEGGGEGKRASGGGFGLVGMGERARLLGGTFAAGPIPGGGWRVTAMVPVDGAGAAA
jgi:signal transduction histidine kinase